MFREEYKKDNEKVSPSPEIKAYIARRLENAEAAEQSETKKDYFKTTFWRATAAVLSLVVLATTMFAGMNLGPKFLTSKDNSDNALGGITAQSLTGVKYSDIYESFKRVEQRFSYGDGVVVTEDSNDAMEEEPIGSDADYDEPQDDAGTDGATKGGSNTVSSPSADINDDREAEDHSETNTQVEGVDEADIVKTDGKYIYSLVGEKIVITSADKGKLGKVSEIILPNTNTNTGAGKSVSGIEPDIYIDRMAYANDMYVLGNRLAFIKPEYYYNSTKNTSEQLVMVFLYDITDKKAPKLLKKIGQSGNYISSRLAGGVLYLFSNQYFYSQAIKEKPETYVPTTYDNDKMAVIPEKDICVFGGTIDKQYLVTGSYKLEDGDQISAKSVLGGGSTIYANTENVLVAAADHGGNSFVVGNEKQSNAITSITRLIRLTISKGEINGEAFGSVPGTLLNQFSMDEHNGYFRLVTTVDVYDKYYFSGGATDTDMGTVSAVEDSSEMEEASEKKVVSEVADTSETVSYEEDIVMDAPDIAPWTNNSFNALYVLDGELNTVGSIENLAQGERVYSVRFTGNVGYFVTFRQVDPLFTVDLSNPKEPKVLSALKIPGFSNYLHPYSDGLLFGLGMNADETTGRTGTMKLSMFDVSNPKDVTEKSKISVNSYYSEASYNHKAILVNQKRDLICFPGENSYFVYGYSADKGFYQRAELSYGGQNYGNQTRGLFIGDYFYICESTTITSYAMNNWQEVDYEVIE